MSEFNQSEVDSATGSHITVETPTAGLAIIPAPNFERRKVLSVLESPAIEI
jgi:hypothetical protein